MHYHQSFERHYVLDVTYTYESAAIQRKENEDLSLKV